MPTADDFRKALRALLDQADRRGERLLLVRAGDLHRRVGGYPAHNHRIPECCRVMRDEMSKGDLIVEAPPKGIGATLTIRYRLPRSGPG